MLHAIGGFPHPWMAAFHPWMAGMSMDGRNLGSTIPYISSLVSTSNSDDIHGWCCHPWMVVPSMDSGDVHGEDLTFLFIYNYLALLHPLSLPIAQQYHVATSF